MSLKTFLLGRWPFITAFVGFALLAGAVVQLDLWLGGTSLRPDNVLYIVILGLVGLLAFLPLDYRRQRDFNQHLAEFTAREALDDLVLLPEPRTPEQELFVQAWHRLYSRLRAELSAEQERGRRHIELVTQWAHHMKTPVAVIDLELQRLGRDADPSIMPTALTSIGEENQRLSHALQMLLNTVRLQDFAADFKVERVDLPELVRQLINDHRRDFIVHRVYPKLELPAGGGGGEGAGEGAGEDTTPSPWLVETDAKWLRFALEQIVSNAVKYASRTDGDRGQVTFAIRHDVDEPATVLEIIDNGIGIPAEDVPRVFNPFFTGAAGRRYPQSTGMGLYLVREVCGRLGHPVALESTPGRGTRVSIRFPRSRAIFTGLEHGAVHRHPSLQER